MALPGSSTNDFLAKLARTSPEQAWNRIMSLSPDRKKIVGESMKEMLKSPEMTAEAAAAMGTSKEQWDFLKAQYFEQIEFLAEAETWTDRIMKKSASEMPQDALQPIEKCREFAKATSEQIFKYWEMLNCILIAHEELIRKRWKKMSRAQRKAVLLEAWPDMSLRHRPDMDTLRKDTPTDPKASNALIWPYINLEDLLRPNALLIFINSRGRYLPDSFAYSDLELAPVYKVRKEYLACRRDMFTMKFLGKKSAKEYGALVGWEDAKAMVESLKAGRTVHVDHGIQILTIQHGILEFLFWTIGGILKGVDKSIWSTTTAQPEPPELTDNDKLLQKPEIIAREAPYRLPSRLDLHHLKALCSAQKSQAIDHALSLREDPGYFVEAVEAYRNHRPELLLNQAGVLHEHAKDFPLYNKALRQMIADAHCGVFYWDHISSSISKLEELSQKYSKEIIVERDLPVEFHEALAETRFFIQSISLDLICIIKTTVPASPPFRQYHYIDDTNLNAPTSHMKSAEIVRDGDPFFIRLLLILGSFGDKGCRDLYTLHALLDEYEFLMHEEPRAKELVTPFLSSYISQLSIMAECLHQLHQFQPWAKKIESSIDDNPVDFMIRYDFLLNKWGQINNIQEKFNEPKLYKLGNPKDGKFFYPADKRQTRETIKHMIAAEAALDTFWKAANANWLRHIGTTPAALVQHIIGERKLQRTAPWTESIKPLFPREARVESDAFVDPFSNHSHDITKQITGSFSKLATSSQSKKKKTRGLAVTTIEEDVSALHIDEPSPKLPVLPVDKRAFKVFKSLFHSSDSVNQPGEVAWHDFLHAMVSVGFAAQKLQGSARHFTPKMLDADRSIQFHEPHPSNKLPFNWARRYGRRLSRAFGWSAESFKLN